MHRLALLVILAVSLAGCFGGPRNFENENDRLRAEVLRLNRQVDRLETQLERRIGQVHALQRQANGATAEVEMPDADPPVLSQLRIGRYSGAVDTDGDDAPEQLRVYLEPLDQRGRLLPVAGRAVLRVVAIPEAGEPRVLAERTWGPDQFDATWRSGLTGRHYTLELDLPEPLPEMPGELTAQVIFTQARTGHVLRAQEVVELPGGEAAGSPE
ncbi:MAG: hypothetical protein ACOCTI_01755 [Phycisphaeraceae bacterium]